MWLKPTGWRFESVTSHRAGFAGMSMVGGVAVNYDFGGSIPPPAVCNVKIVQCF